MVDASVRAFGRIDVLVNDAAAFVFGRIEDVTAEDWERVLSVNLIGPANAVKHVLPYMRAVGAGSIVNIASVSSFIAQPGFVPYNSSKGALLQLTRCLAMDLAPDNIRVNCICPGGCQDAGVGAAPGVHRGVRGGLLPGGCWGELSQQGWPSGRDRAWGAVLGVGRGVVRDGYAADHGRGRGGLGGLAGR